MRWASFLVVCLAGSVQAASSAETLQVVTTDRDGIWAFSSNGDGTFGNGIFYFVGTGVEPWHVAAADLNGDGLTDVISSNRSGPSIAVFINTGQEFEDAVLYDAGAKPYATDAGDFDEDGDLDLAVANPVGSGVLVLLENQGDGTFVFDTDLYLGNETYGVACEDFDKDGHVDMAVVNSATDDVQIILGHGDGTFELAGRLIPEDNPKDAAIGHFNDDELPDLAIVNYDSASVTVFLNDGGGYFDPGRSHAAGVQPRHVVCADLDVDGYDDLVVAGGRGSEEVFILYGQGDDRFTAATAYHMGPRPNAVAVADANGDGLLDVFSANWALDNEELASVSVLTATGAPRTFAKLQDFTPPQGFAKITFLIVGTLGGVRFVRADVNGDGIITISDAIVSLRYLFGMRTLDCLDTADFNDNGIINLADSILILSYIFGGGTAPSPPFPAPGTDPTPDSLPCMP